MRIWDRGTYECQKWEAGKVIVSFAGERVRGRYALFRTGGREGLDDPPHGPAGGGARPVPRRRRADAGAAGRRCRPSDEGWAAEVKWDGVRAIAYCRPGRLALQTRNLNDVTAQYPEVRRLSRQLGARDAVLDGELVAFDEHGLPSFERLQQRIHQTSESVVRRRMKSHPVTYVIFDLLYLDGKDLTGEPYSRRARAARGARAGRAELADARLLGGPCERSCWRRAREQGLEGIVMKRLDSAYAPGKRNGSWLKVKNVGRQEFVIGGWQPGEGRRRNQARLAPARLLRGRRAALRRQSRHRLLGGGPGGARQAPGAAGARDQSLRQAAGPRGVRFVEPELVAEIEFRELTTEGMVRHGSFKGLREDKPATEVALE